MPPEATSCSTDSSQYVGDPLGVHAVPSHVPDGRKFISLTECTVMASGVLLITLKVNSDSLCEKFSSTGSADGQVWSSTSAVIRSHWLATDSSAV